MPRSAVTPSADPPPRDRLLGPVVAVRSRDDLVDLLRRRIRFVALFGVVMGPLLAAVPLAVRWRLYLAQPGRLFSESPFAGWLIVAALYDAAIAGYLAPGRSRTLRQVRVVEALFLASIIGALLAIFPRALVDTLSNRAMVYVTAQGFTLLWVAAMLLYAIFIPNTWQRCATVLAAMFLLAIVPDAVILLRTGAVPASISALYLGVKATFVGGAVVTGVYGAYRVALLEQDVSNALTLGPYTLKDRIGGGGMGEVFLAEHHLLRRPCAVKIIRSDALGDDSVAARFEREVQTTATLTHPNTVQIYDYGRSDDGTFYYAMEYLPGASLEQLVGEHGPLAEPRAVNLLIQLCGALGEAHAHGLVHRDIKPSNVIVCERGGVRDVAKLLDFGLVTTAAAPTDSKLTQAGVLLGTPAFMSPEQCAGDGEVTPASDIYSLGALAYYVLTGHTVFEHRSPMQILAAHLYEQPKSMHEHGVDVSPEVESALMRCLAKNPADRFAGIGDVEIALRGASVMM